MPHYKSLLHFTLNNSQNFDITSARAPGIVAPDAGIYRCTGCGHEIGIAKGHVLPPQNHHQHNNYLTPIRWQLVAAAIEKGSP